jgi:hypothetical protein
MTPEHDEIVRFLDGQVAAWNRGDRAAFFEFYRAASPVGLEIDYVGQPRRDAWQVLQGMWDEQNAKIEIEVILKIVNGTEAACHHRNHVRGAGRAINTIELFAFGDGLLTVRYFISSLEAA